MDTRTVCPPEKRLSGDAFLCLGLRFVPGMGGGDTLAGADNDMTRSTLTEKIGRSRQIIGEALAMLGPESPLLVQFSGGEDSMAVLILALEVTTRVEACYMTSGLDLPGSIEFAQDQASRFWVPLFITNPDQPLDFFGQVTRYRQWPTVRKAWCSWRQKVRPQRRQLRARFGRRRLVKLTGVRRHESSRRMQIYQAQGEISPDRECGNSFVAHPILEWTDDEVLEFLGMYPEIATKSPLYWQVGVSGCYWCPFYQTSIIERIARTFPGIYQSVIDTEAVIGRPSCNGQHWARDIVARVESSIS